jgi:hypothetical protein
MPRATLAATTVVFALTALGCSSGRSGSSDAAAATDLLPRTDGDLKPGGDAQASDGSGGPDQATCKTLCGGVCVDLTTSCDHCGKCDNACGPDEICCNGKLVSRIGAAGPPLIGSGPWGILVYGRYANQGQSNKVNVLPDFSHAGYEGGGVALPTASVKKTLSPVAGDDRAQIQAAIDAVSKLTPAPTACAARCCSSRGPTR